MDAVLLDTDVFSYLIRAHRHAEQYKRHVMGKRLAVSFITVGELYAGAARRGWGPAKRQSLESKLHTVVVVPFDNEVCLAYAQIATLKTPGGSDRVIAANDRWIAACAIRHRLPLVSNNRRHFQDIPGLTLISEAPAATVPKPQPLPLTPPST